MAKRTPSGLTDQQRRFVDEYLVDLNATQAALRAGYKPKAAGAQGSNLLKNPKVQSAVAEAKAKRAERVEVKQDDTLRQLIRIATADVRQAFDKDGALLAIADMPDEIASAISSIEVDHEFDEETGAVVTTKKIKFWEKTKALELSMKHLGLLIERHKVDHTVMTFEQMVLASLKTPAPPPLSPSEPAATDEGKKE